ncbi:Type I site-specific deoxyribonuclease [Burkholderia pseudomallei]|nr:Type I site-specific deoxyribonuclease [Burkholderia pseudomallei]CAJ4234576.1 Type I site-specific deoxyribonuclease [Burkholderia pseudomallei]CAK0569121.1 Type I site-specific deoxyribonuclease [Burkholderia pseudomallei]
MGAEAIAREEIDRQLHAAGWTVQNHKDMNLYASLGVAVREFPLKTGFADYLLYADGQVIGVVEAKPEGHTLTGVETQSSKYTLGLPDGLPVWKKPLPFSYESTGTVTQFTNALEPDARSRDVFTFHRPEELVRLAKLGGQVRGRLREMPPVEERNLWGVQGKAIKKLEESLAQNRPKALIQMATGSGKTFTACNIAYRLLSFAKAKRILFLVDRSNLGRQTEAEFQNFQAPHTGYKFNEEYPVQRLTKNTIADSSKVVITTIQRLYSMLKGEAEYDEGNEETSQFEVANPLVKEPVPVVYNAKVPIETFDFIIIDECHRSIYNVWRQVLEYFDAFLIGLTATPTPQTIGFFDNNVVVDYGHEKAVADGVNVGCEVYRIATRLSAQGATLEKEPGILVPHRDKRTLKKRLAELADDLTYTANQLDRDVVALDQIRLVIRTFKERLFTEIFPGRTEVPKTLVFAKTDLHADDIVKVIRAEFGRGNDFCVKITSKTTGDKPENLLAQFRNSYNPRVAVTVDMIATGTDVRAIECLLFMRNITSASYFEQMKGRGSRVIDHDSLKAVSGEKTPPKTHFVIVDAVGVCESDKTACKPLDVNHSVPFGKVLQAVAQGYVHADIVSTLAARLARLGRELSAEQAGEITKASGGQSLATLTGRLLSAIDPDANAEAAKQRFGLVSADDATEAQLDEVERDRMREALKPFANPKLRELLIEVKTQAEQVIDEITQDELLSAAYSAAAKEKAKTIMTEFKSFVEQHKDDIEAIQVLYSKPYRLGLRFGQVKDLARKLAAAPFHVNPARPDSVTRLWQYAELAEPEKVRHGGGQHLVDLIALVRHAIDPATVAEPIADVVESRFARWLGEKQAQGMNFDDEQLAWLVAIKDHIAHALSIDADDLTDDVNFARMGGLGKVVQLFGERWRPLLDELNERLAA